MNTSIRPPQIAVLLRERVAQVVRAMPAFLVRMLSRLPGASFS